MLYIQIQDDCWVKGKEFYAGDLKKFSDFDAFIKSGWAPQAILDGHAEIAKRFEWDKSQYWNTKIPFDFVESLKTDSYAKKHFSEMLREHALNVAPWTPFINMHVEKDLMHMQWTVTSFPENPQDFQHGVPKDAVMNAEAGTLKHKIYDGPPTFDQLNLDKSTLASYQKQMSYYHFDTNKTHVYTWVPFGFMPKAAKFGTLYGIGDKMFSKGGFVGLDLAAKVSTESIIKTIPPSLLKSVDKKKHEKLAGQLKKHQMNPQTNKDLVDAIAAMQAYEAPSVSVVVNPPKNPIKYMGLDLETVDVDQLKKAMAAAGVAASEAATSMSQISSYVTADLKATLDLHEDPFEIDTAPPVETKRYVLVITVRYKLDWADMELKEYKTEIEAVLAEDPNQKEIQFFVEKFQKQFDEHTEKVRSSDEDDYSTYRLEVQDCPPDEAKPFTLTPDWELPV